MRLIRYKKWIIFAVLVSFLWSIGCATTESYKAPVRVKTEAYIIELEDEVVDGQYDTMPLGAGDIAPGDGIWIDKESAKDLSERTGLRPGEKLYEELITEGEGIIPTSHKKIMVLKGRECDMDLLKGGIDELAGLAYEQDAEKIKEKLQEIVPEYKPLDNGESDTASLAV